jgi:hypothetical protein
MTLSRPATLFFIATRIRVKVQFKLYKEDDELSTVLAIKKVTPHKNVRLFSNFSWLFKMLPLMFELLNHLHKKSVQLGKGIKKATRAHRPLSKDLNLSKKKVIFGGANCQ